MLLTASVVSIAMVMIMNTWNEAIRLAAELLRRLRAYSERDIKRYFTRDCYRYDPQAWHYDPRVVRCVRAWYFRALTSIAHVIVPLIKAYGVGVVREVIEEVDLARIDTEDLLRSLSSAIYELALSHVMGDNKNVVNITDTLIGRLISQGIGDVSIQLQRIDAMLRKCRDGFVIVDENERISCEDLWMYESYLNQVLASLKRLAMKYNVITEAPRTPPWWLYE